MHLKKQRYSKKWSYMPLTKSYMVHPEFEAGSRVLIKHVIENYILYHSKANY